MSKGIKRHDGVLAGPAVMDGAAHL